MKKFKDTNTISFSLDCERFTKRPTDDEARGINNRIATGNIVINIDELPHYAKLIGEKGQSFSPATFTDGKRRQNNFEQMQILPLDFDGEMSLDDAMAIAELYDVKPFAAYETFRSVDNNRFRFMFLHNASINNEKDAKVHLEMLATIFQEADKSCYKDISKMYFGGKKLLFVDDEMPMVSTESLVRNMTNCLRKRHGDTNYKKYITKIAKSHGITLTKKGDIATRFCENIDDNFEISGTEHCGATNESGCHGKSDNFLPCAIIYDYIITPDGKNLRNR
jgi:hypothetical protein